MVAKGWQSKFSWALRLVQVGQAFHHGIVMTCMRLTTGWGDVEYLCKVSSSSPRDLSWTMELSAVGQVCIPAAEALKLLWSLLLDSQ